MSAASATVDKGKGKARDESAPDVPLPHPAEDLSSDDDILSWILVDQLGGMPNSRLGVHPQENKFVGPKFKTEEVLDIVRETVVKGNTPSGMTRLQEFHLIQAHLKAKRTESQRERFIQHLRRYLLPYAPNSRVDIHTTDRYSHVTLHPELAVYATRPLAPGTVLQELQGSVVELPEEWRKEMDLSDDFIEARLAAGEESDDDESDADDEDALPNGADRRAGGNDASGSASSSAPASRVTKGKGKEKEADKGARRSGRTRRRDFSIVWSELKRCYQLFLGPARFLNHDCSPNVELLRQGKYVTFRVTRPVRIGEELTTFYGTDYFGQNNIECLCLSCELAQRGPYAVKASSSAQRSRSEASRSATPGTPVKVKTFKPSRLRESVLAKGDGDDAADSPSIVEDADQATDSIAESSTMNAAFEEAVIVPSDVDELDSSDDDTPEPIKRERLSRAAKPNVGSFALHKKRGPSGSGQSSGGSQSPFNNLSTPHPDDDLPEDFPRCATCAAALHERMWFGGRYFEHCPRCTRHAFIFSLPWPAHKSNEVQEYPPSHLIPPNYVPTRISTVPLPSLTKKRIMPVATVDPSIAEQGMLPVSKEYRAQLRLRKEIALEEFTTEALREAAWAVHVAYEESLETARLQVEARLEEKRQAKAAKKARDAEKIRGSGVWSRYVYITEEEVQRREQERHAITLGTRRGGRYKREDMEDTPEREMREVRQQMRKEWDDEEKALGKMRMESWKAELPLESILHGTPKGKVRKAPTSPVSPTSPTKGRKAVTVGEVKPKRKWKHSKAARTARTVKAAAARRGRKSMPNLPPAAGHDAAPSVKADIKSASNTSAFAAVLARLDPRAGKAKGKGKGKGQARRAASEAANGLMSDADTISDVNDLIDTSRMSKKQIEQLRVSPEKTTSRVLPKNGGRASSSTKPKARASMPSLPTAKTAKVGIVKAAGTTFRRLAPKPSAANARAATTSSPFTEEDEDDRDWHANDSDEGEGETDNDSEKLVSAALGTVASSSGSRDDGKSKGNGKSRISLRVGNATPSGSGKRTSTSKAKESDTGKMRTSTVVKLGKRKERRSETPDNARATSSSLTPDNWAPVTSAHRTPPQVPFDAEGEDDAAAPVEGEPPVKRKRGRPPGTGRLQKQAAASIQGLGHRPRTPIPPSAAGPRLSNRLIQSTEKAKAGAGTSKGKGRGKGKEETDKPSGKAAGKTPRASAAAAMSSKKAGKALVRDGSVTAATFVSDNVPGERSVDTSEQSHGADVMSDANAVEAQAGAELSDAESAYSAYIKPAQNRNWNEHAPSRTPSPFLRRSSMSENAAASNSTGGSAPRPARRPTPPAMAEPPQPMFQTREYIPPPFARPVAGFATMRTDHYEPFGTQRNAFANARPGPSSGSPFGNGDGVNGNGSGSARSNGSGSPERRSREARKGRRANIDYGSHRKLIQETLGADTALQPDKRTPASQARTPADILQLPGSRAAEAAAATAAGHTSQRKPRPYVPRTAIPYRSSH